MGAFQDWLLPVVIGGGFGACMQRAGVHEVLLLRHQMTMSSFVMMKMFVGAMSTSMIVFNMLARSRSKRVRAAVEKTALEYTTGSDKGVVAKVVGCFTLGVGMTVCGSCPGTVFAQIGAGSVMALWVAVGGVIGASIYGLLLPCESSSSSSGDDAAGKRKTKSSGKSGAADSSLWTRVMTTGSVSESNASVYALCGTTAGQSVVGIALGSALLLGCIGLEALVPWRADLTAVRADADWTNSMAPTLAGVLIGLLQWPLTVGRATNLGCSTSFLVTAAGTIFSWSDKPCFARARQRSFWQLVMGVSMAAGAYVASVYTVTLLPPAVGHNVGGRYVSDALVPATVNSTVTMAQALFGGALCVFGARVANGCTSGHGLSGSGHLATGSLCGVAAIFAGAMSTAFLFFRE